MAEVLLALRTLLVPMLPPLQMPRQSGKTVEGFTMTAELYFEGKRHWGPAKCHQNAVRIATALREADPRLELRLDNASKSVEGVTATVSLKKKDKLLLNEYAIHNNMVPMVDIIKTIWAISPPPN
ncbi:unnamed protein product [Clonostachys solani]|uniref:Uncharacterized protein n=1 Tax=Clonostachys solani TaxID=160281 RepID=A0A9N9ZFA4_9HYPO|nr:unnamed protein product [Clonostachys solani]